MYNFICFHLFAVDIWDSKYCIFPLQSSKIVNKQNILTFLHK